MSTAVLEEKREPKLLDRVREAIRVRHMSLRTEKAYLHWIEGRCQPHGTAGALAGLLASAAFQAASGWIFRLSPRAIPWAEGERPFGPQADLAGNVIQRRVTQAQRNRLPSGPKVRASSAQPNGLGYDRSRPSSEPPTGRDNRRIGGGSMSLRLPPFCRASARENGAVITFTRGGFSVPSTWRCGKRGWSSPRSAICCVIPSRPIS